MLCWSQNQEHCLSLGFDISVNRNMQVVDCLLKVNITNTGELYWIYCKDCGWFGNIGGSVWPGSEDLFTSPQTHTLPDRELAAGAVGQLYIVGVYLV